MDIKHRTAFARVKQDGVSEPILLNVGMSVTQLLGQILIAMRNMPARYQGVDIRIEFEPIGRVMTTMEQDLQLMIGMIDPNLIEQATEEEELVMDARWNRNPMNPRSTNYDPLYHEYQNCSSSKHREIKGPGDLAELRKHMESTYRGTEWWDGSHTW